jgi:Tol biopolymer transport system component
MAVAMTVIAAPMAAHGLPTSELPTTGVTGVSLDQLVEATERTASTTESLSEVYAWLAEVDRAERRTFIGCPAWLADGSGLVYCSGSDGFAEIFEITPEGTVRQLTFLGGQASSPTISPDGSLLVFEAIYGDDGPQVYAIPREGQRGRTVLVGSAAIDIPGERAAALTSEGSNYDPAFQPDGERIAFTSDRSGVPSLWSMNVDGSDQSQMLLASTAR